MASTAVTSVGTVPRGGTSTGTATFTFTENSAAAFAGGGTLIVTILDSAAGATVTFGGTPVVTAPGSLGASASVAGNVLTITTTGADATNVEQVSVSGLTISATIGAATGAIAAALTGTLAAGVTSATATAAGTLATSVAAGATAVVINVTSTCDFAVTGGVNGNLTWGTITDSVAITVAPARAAGQQTLTTAALASAHTAGEAVTQTVANCAAGALASPGTVADVVVQNAGAPTTVNPGENNQAAAITTITEQTAGYLASGTVLTFTLSAGLFSSSPAVAVTAGDLTLGTTVCNISFDRTNCSVTTTAASTAPSTVTLSGILLDIPAATPLGTSVNVTVTGAPAILVDITANTIAFVSRVVVGTAAQPTIYINENDQSSGQISLTESAAGFFTDGTGSNNAFGLCITTGESFTRAPYAVVTSGNLLLLSGLVGATSVRGTLYSVGGNSCARWTVYTASTTASTIEIRGSDAADAVLPSGANNGPRLSVPGGLTPGSTQANILIGTQAAVAAGTAVTSVVSNAVRAYRSDIVVAAVSQPIIVKGATSKAGDITITETLAGQFKPGETICVDIQARAGNFYVQDTFFNTSSTNMTPVVQTNAAATGLLVGGVTVNSGCGFADNRAAFTFTITQQAFGPTPGVITLSNMWMTTTADAPNGPVSVRVFRSNGIGVDFGAFVSNAVIGNPVAGTAATRLGVTQVGAFTIATKIPAVGKYVTYRLDFGVAAAGQAVQIWGATKTGNDWSAFTVVTTRIANASGVVYYYIRQNSATWKSYRGYWVGGGAWTPARQARWLNQ
jgi:hypothetical protein